MSADLSWHFNEARHPPKPPAGEVGVYGGPAREGSTTRLVYKYDGVHVTVSEARGRFTMTARWKGWTHTEMGLDTRQQAFDLARAHIEILRSVAASTGISEAIREFREALAKLESKL